MRLASLSLPVIVAVAVPCFSPVSAPMAQDQRIDTPFGKAPRECLVRHPDGSRVSETSTGLKVRYPDGTTREYTASAACRDFARELRRRRAPTSTTGIPNGWFTYAATLVSAGVGTFTATYTVPPLPASATPQILYYYIGLESGAEGGSSPILQPVLTYGGKSATPGYTLTTYVVDSKGGIINQGSVITGLQPGDTALASITQVTPSSYAVSASWQGQPSSLVWDGAGGAVFDSSYVTLEIDTVTTCSQFPAGPFTAGSIALVDVNHMSQSPTWFRVVGQQCGSTLTVDADNATISIQETEASALPR